MTKPDRLETTPSRGEELSLPAPCVALLDAPLDYILADHKRQRVVCGLLHEFVLLGRADRAEALRVAGYLAGDLALHIQDEEVDLFAVVRRRALPEDGLGPLLAQLSVEHARNRQQVVQIVAALQRTGGGDIIEFADEDVERMQVYAAREQRHLALENGILLPIARKRLTAGDLKAMSESMRARRGVPA